MCNADGRFEPFSIIRHDPHHGTRSQWNPCTGRAQCHVVTSRAPCWEAPSEKEEEEEGQGMDGDKREGEKEEKNVFTAVSLIVKPRVQHGHYAQSSAA